MHPQRISSNESTEPAGLPVRGRDGQEPPPPVLTFAPAGSRWEERIKNFLREHPASPRLAVLQSILPHFLAFPAERRARAWHWVKEQLLEMETRGVVACTGDENGVALWSVQEPPHARHRGICGE